MYMFVTLTAALNYRTMQRTTCTVQRNLLAATELAETTLSNSDPVSNVQLNIRATENHYSSTSTHCTADHVQ